MAHDQIIRKEEMNKIRYIKKQERFRKTENKKQGRLIYIRVKMGFFFCQIMAAIQIIALAVYGIWCAVYGFRRFETIENILSIGYCCFCFLLKD